MIKYDVLIIGAGIAGLYTAMNLPKTKKVLVICKDVPWECNTFYAQGGIVTAIDEADVPLHVHDTMIAGANHNDESAVRVMSEMSIELIKDIIDRGMPFDVGDDGNILYTKEAAHSANRIIHAGGDATGRHMHHFMMAQNPHPLQRNTLVYDLLLDNGKCYGVKALVNYESMTIYADEVVIASGGVGSLYDFNTNSRTVSGDIHGICVEKGITLCDMEMMQFHPTVFVKTPFARKLLLTEALRGEGAYITNEEGRRFLFDYDDRGELASRDIVSRAIFDYKRKHDNQDVYLDFSMFNEEWFAKRFPNITKSFDALGYHFPQDRLPISPAFHYAVGGISCDIDGCVEGIESLYVIGEAASSGVHGANRLASNSLLEGVVFGKRVANHILAKESKERKVPKYKFDKDYMDILKKPNDNKYKNILRKTMWNDVGVVRTRASLLRAKNVIYDIKSRDVGRLLMLRLNTASAIVESALKRKHSLGTHYIE